MRKIYLMVAMFLAGGMAYGQNNDQEPAQPREMFDVVTKGDAKPSDFYMKTGDGLKSNPYCHGDTIMYEDFANGLTGNNSFGAWDTTGSTSQYWEHDFDGPNNYPSLGSIQSPTAGNGNMIFDLYGNHPGGFADAPVEGYLVTPLMDLSANPYPRIEFYTYFVHCCNYEWDMELEVSTDGGANWATSFNISKNVDRNVVSPNPMVMGFNLASAISADPANVKIRFSWDARSPDPNGQYSSEYFWQLDDILVKDANLNDLEAGVSGMEPNNSSVIDGQVGVDWPIAYNQIPLNQAYEMAIGAEVCNIGQNPLTGVQTQVNLGRNGTPLDTVYSPAQTLNAQTCFGDTLAALYTPSAAFTGNYTAALSVKSDSADCIPSDNIPLPDTLRFSMTNTVYALDDYARMGATGDVTAPADGSGGYQDFKAANLFEFFAADTIKSISFYAHPDSTENGAGPFTVKLYGLDLTTEHATSGGEFIDFANSERDTGMITVDLNSPYVVAPGDTLYASVNYSGGSLNFGVGTAGGVNPGSTSLINGDFGGSGVAWYRTGDMPIVRLNMADMPTEVTEQKDNGSFNLGQNRPNPFTNQTVIPYELAKVSNVKFEVFDIAGKQVMTLDRGNESKGEHQIRIDGGQLDAGIYYYALTVDGKRETKKMVITE